MSLHTVQAKGILSAKNGMNLYRGCQHGCIYCDSRSICYQFAHDFDDIEVKENAIELLEQALKSKRKRCMIGTGSMTDPYIPLEDKFLLTRRALEVIDRYGFGVAIITKSDRVLRDIDLLRSINFHSKAVIQMTMTTFDDELCRILEPGVCTTSRRYEVLKILHENGIPTVVWLCPILPYINDTEENIRGIVQCCIDAGVRGIINFGMGLTLREGSREYFYAQLDRHFPGMRRQYEKSFGNAYEIPSPNSRNLNRIFHEMCEKTGIMHDNEEIFRYINKFEDKAAEDQLSLF